MLKTSFLLVCLAVSAVAADNYFKVLIREIDNPAGTLLSGDKCNLEFGFLGLGCNVFLKAGVSASNANVVDSYLNTAAINTHMETRISDLNLVLTDDQAATVDSFTGFYLHIQLSSGDPSSANIDNYTIRVNTTESQGVSTYTSTRPGTLGTTISFAWSTNIAPPSTTSTPEPTTTGVPFTGTTQQPTTTPRPPVDCSEVANTTTGIQYIYPDGSTPIAVYCDQTSYGAYTVIQSRGTSGDNITFDRPIANYSDWFGTSGKGNNFWFGLDNMNLLSGLKNYALQIDLCCGTTLVAKQIYHNFKVDSKDNKYKLTAKADVAGVGLDFSSSAKDLGAAFSTFDAYNGQKSKDSCDQFGFYDDNADKGPSTHYGGWWYGSCGNNLNGFLYPYVDQCSVSMTTFDSSLYLGVNMRTTSGQGFNGYDVDLKSYDRVRMALFTFDSTAINRNDKSFCQ